MPDADGNRSGFLQGNQRNARERVRSLHAALIRIRDPQALHYIICVRAGRQI